nr:amidohydrolase [Pseudonocardiales bacterium]
MGAAAALQPHTIALRRSLHRHPEQGLHLPETQSAVLRALADLPVQVHTGEAASSVVGVIDGARPGPTVLLRADMDALPITELSGVPF